MVLTRVGVKVRVGVMGVLDGVKVSVGVMGVLDGMGVNVAALKDVKVGIGVRVKVGVMVAVWLAVAVTVSRLGVGERVVVGLNEAGIIRVRVGEPVGATVGVGVFGPGAN